MQGWWIVAVALGYVSALFALAWYGDRFMRNRRTSGGRPLIYALSLAVYCTSWTFFGSVGLAASSGYDFIPVYLGPVLMFALGWPLVLRIVRLAKSQNITSIADFMSARYGKSLAVAAVVTLVAVVGILPYVALQLKAISVSIETLLGGSFLAAMDVPRVGFMDTAFLITLTLAAFAILFGTRHLDATEHQHGLMVAIAAESLVKLTAFVVVGLFVVFGLIGGIEALVTAAENSPEVARIFGQGFDGVNWITVTFLSLVNIVLLPRQFHVTVVENKSENEVRRAAWLFPAYLVLINLFVIPIAIGGLIILEGPGADPDFYMLQLPLNAKAEMIALIAFLGGLSAATAMVIVESIALAVMISNGLVVPLLLRHRLTENVPHGDMAPLLLLIRRVSIVIILLLGYGAYQMLGRSQGLAAIGLVAFAAIAQLAPAFFGGLVWRRATARGAIAGILTGFALWAYTLLLPWAARAGWLSMGFIEDGPFGLAILKPQALLYVSLEPLTHGVLWSLCANLLAYIGVSLMRLPEPIERVQAQIFVQERLPRAVPSTALRLWRTSITLADLQRTAARYLGSERAERSFSEYASSRNIAMTATTEADIQAIRFTEHLLASAIGAASSRLVLSLLMRRGNVSSYSAMKLLDDASEALQYNRDLLQSALDQVRHGLSVYDKEMRLICWNRQFRELLNLPPELGRVGVPLDLILRVCAERGDFGPGPVEGLVSDRLMRLAVTKETFQETLHGRDRVIEIRTSPMPQGGIVTTFSDITDRVTAANELARVNETLERRVRERTAELLEVNAALAIAKVKADEANLDKTRFVAAASHDILQPLNAARLYAASLVERPLPSDDATLAKNLDASLSAVEEIFSTLIEISRIDAGRLEPDIGDFALAEIFDQLRLEFLPMAQEKGLQLKVMPTSVWVRSDRRMLRRVLQNFVSNAIKYTRTGTVVLGLRRRGATVVVQVLDTGPGIPEDKRQVIFKEFHRLEGPGSNVRGLGLGLSIVERIGRVLKHPIDVVSSARRGSMFSVEVPRAAPRPQSTPALVSLTQPGSLASLSLLCIDNEPAVLDGMQTLLRGWGCRVRTAGSVEKAVAALADDEPPPDAILADYHLDRGTGVEAIIAVRAAAGRDIPAIVITADHTADVQREVRRLGLGLLRKPLKAAALRAVLTQTIVRRPAAAE